MAAGLVGRNRELDSATGLEASSAGSEPREEPQRTAVVRLDVRGDLPAAALLVDGDPRDVVDLVGLGQEAQLVL